MGALSPLARGSQAVTTSQRLRRARFDAFRWVTEVGYRAIRIQESPFRGQDERQFVRALRSEGAIFLTGDLNFVRDVGAERIRHGGIWYVPRTLTRDERNWAATVICGFFRGVRPHDLRDLVAYFAHDGLHIVTFDADELVYSFDELDRDLTAFEAEFGSTVRPTS